MNFINRLKSYLTNDEVDIQDRQYVLVAWIGIVSIGIAVIAGILIGENVSSILTAATGGIVFGSFTWICYKKGRLDISALVIAAILVIVFEPLNFFTSGGIHGGAALWYAFTIAYIALILKGKWRVVFIVLELISVIATYALALYKPELVVIHDEETAFADSLMSLIIVSALLCIMIYFQTWLLATEIRRTRAQALEIEKINKAQSRFFSSISHEIRTPINTIIGLNEMILRQDKLPREVTEDAANIQAASEMLLNLINDILDMSRIESGKMDIIPVKYKTASMLREIVAMIRVRADEKELAFNIDVDPSLPAGLIGDEMRIKQILINLLNNSLKYTAEGSVTFSVRCEKTGINSGSETDSNDFDRNKSAYVRLIFTVSDTGMGIRKESIPYLFDAFRREDVDRNRYIEGTGLGLSIVKQLTDLMGGEIEVESEYGKGTTFILRLDQQVAEAGRIGEFDPDEVENQGTRSTYQPKFVAPDAEILLVDDNKVNLMVESKLLKATGVKITTAISGRECLELTTKTEFDVIFMDHMMPEMDGIECLHAIRRQENGLNRTTPVVILTANAGNENKAMYEKEGFDGYLVKPVKGAELEEMLIGFLPGDITVLS